MNNYLLYSHIFAPFRFAPWPLLVVVFFFSVVVHEVAHGWMALKCGDDTAKMMGRLTLNPIPHIDILGTIIVPIVLHLLGGFIIGWAKPVPINPYNFYDIKTCIMKVGAAGPLSNFTLAVGFAILVWLFNLSGITNNTELGFMLTAVLAGGVTVNIILGLFNLTPIPPLDGSKIVGSLLPYELSLKYERIAPYGFFILILLLGFIWRVIMAFGNIFYRLLFIGMPV